MISIILFQACAAIVPLPKGTPAKCDGLLWSIEATQNALQCRRVEVPKLTADLQLCRQTSKAKIEALEIQLRTAKEIINTFPEPSPAWLLPTVAASSFVLGGLLAVTLAGAL